MCLKPVRPDIPSDRARIDDHTGMFPGCFYLLAMWYRREEAQKRYTFFFCSTTLAGAFGGLLASAIGKMDGLRGYRGWRWVFIIGASPL